MWATRTGRGNGHMRQEERDVGEDRTVPAGSYIPMRDQPLPEVIRTPYQKTAIPEVGEGDHTGLQERPSFPGSGPYYVSKRQQKHIWSDCLRTRTSAQYTQRG